MVHDRRRTLMRSNDGGDRGHRTRVLVGTLACVLMLAGCGPAATSTDGAALPPPSAVPSAPAASVPASAPATAAAVDTAVDAAAATATGLNGATLRGVTPFDGGVLAVGADGDGAAAWTSRDGAAWEPAEVRDAGAARSLEAVAFAGRGVMFGGDDLGDSPAWTSDDGMSWQPVDGATGIDGRVNAVVAEGGRWVAVGDVVDDETGEAYGGVVWTSGDAKAWKVATEMTLDEGTVSDVAVAGDTTVVVGFDVAGGKVWTSTGDGDFAATGGGDFAGMTIQGVATVAGGFVALGMGPDLRAYAWTSPDGTTWTRDELPADVVAPDDEIHELATVGDRVVAVGVTADGGGVWTSRDGRSWSVGS
jgi:hypothetical protein